MPRRDVRRLSAPSVSLRTCFALPRPKWLGNGAARYQPQGHPANHLTMERMKNERDIREPIDYNIIS